MSDGDCTRCGHGYYKHNKDRRMRTPPCSVWESDPEARFGGDYCSCSGFTVAVLPTGERLEFGKHRLPQDEAETAPAWPPLP